MSPSVVRFNLGYGKDIAAPDEEMKLDAVARVLAAWHRGCSPDDADALTLRNMAPSHVESGEIGIHELACLAILDLGQPRLSRATFQSHQLSDDPLILQREIEELKSERRQKAAFRGSKA